MDVVAVVSFRCVVDTNQRSHCALDRPDTIELEESTGRLSKSVMKACEKLLGTGCYKENRSNLGIGRTDQWLEPTLRVSFRKICGTELDSYHDRFSSLIDISEETRVEYATGRAWG